MKNLLLALRDNVPDTEVSANLVDDGLDTLKGRRNVVIHLGYDGAIATDGLHSRSKLAQGYLCVDQVFVSLQRRDGLCRVLNL